MSKLRLILGTLGRDEDGQALVEYGLILGLIALVAIVGITSMSGGVDGLYDVVEAASEAMRNAMGA